MTRYLRYALPALAGVLLVGLLVFMATAPHGGTSSARHSPSGLDISKVPAPPSGCVVAAYEHDANRVVTNVFFDCGGSIRKVPVSAE